MDQTLTHLEVSASPRYWEDACVNGEEDLLGNLIPCRVGDLWKPLIRIKDGQIENWVQGVSAYIHYKVCDDGEYWLSAFSNSRFTKLLKWRGYYVPDEYLCPGEEGFGDYIVLNVGPDGKIENWVEPRFNAYEWVSVENTEVENEN